MSLIAGAILGGAAINAGAQWWNTRQQQKALDFQKDQWAYSKEASLNAVQNRVKDLKAAGLSPTLAAGSAASPPPVNSITAPQFNPPDFTQLGLGIMSALKMKADISQTEAQKELIMQQAIGQKIGNDYAARKVLSEIERNLGAATGSRASARASIARSALDEHDLRIFKKWKSPSRMSQVGMTTRDVSQFVDTWINNVTRNFRGNSSNDNKPYSEEEVQNNIRRR